MHTMERAAQASATQNAKRKRAPLPDPGPRIPDPGSRIPDPNCVLVCELSTGYQVGPGRETKLHDCSPHPAYRQSRCRTKASARRAVTRWCRKLNLRRVYHGSLLEDN